MIIKKFNQIAKNSNSEMFTFEGEKLEFSQINLNSNKLNTNCTINNNKEDSS